MVENWKNAFEIPENNCKVMISDTEGRFCEEETLPTFAVG